MRAEWREARWGLADKRREWIERQNDWTVDEKWRRNELENNHVDNELRENLINNSELVNDEEEMEEVVEDEGEVEVEEVMVEEEVEKVKEKSMLKGHNVSETAGVVKEKKGTVVVDNHGMTSDIWQSMKYPPPGVVMVTRGHTPPSTMADIIHNQHTVTATQSSRGHPPPSTIQHLLHPFVSREATPPSNVAPPTFGREFPCAPSKQYTLSMPQLSQFAKSLTSFSLLSLSR